jgi:Tfp pilus assembly protein PilN
MFGAWPLAIIVGLWLYLGIQSQKADVQVALDQAVADSARYAQLIANQRSLRARQDTIAQKLAMIQEIDAGRYVWPHIMDEVSRALPPYTWLLAIDDLSGGTNPQFQIEGRTGSLPALTRYMDALEASPFLRNIELISSEQARIGGNDNMIVNNFVLAGVYESPPVEMVETVPLFPNGGSNTATGSEASDGAARTP